MQKCGNCNAHFSWSEMYKSIWLSYKPIKCNECETTHKITIPSRFIFGSFTILPMFTFTYLLSPFSNGLVTLGLAFFIFLIGSLLPPFLVIYKKSLWTIELIQIHSAFLLLMKQFSWIRNLLNLSVSYKIETSPLMITSYNKMGNLYRIQAWIVFIERI